MTMIDQAIPAQVTDSPTTSELAAALEALSSNVGIVRELLTRTDASQSAAVADCAFTLDVDGALLDAQCWGVVLAEHLHSLRPV